MLYKLVPCRSIYKSRGSLGVGVNKGGEGPAQTGLMWVILFKKQFKLPRLCCSAEIEATPLESSFKRVCAIRSMFMLWNIKCFSGYRMEMYGVPLGTISSFARCPLLYCFFYLFSPSVFSFWNPSDSATSQTRILMSQTDSCLYIYRASYKHLPAQNLTTDTAITGLCRLSAFLNRDQEDVTKNDHDLLGVAVRHMEEHRCCAAWSWCFLNRVHVLRWEYN